MDPQLTTQIIRELQHWQRILKIKENNRREYEKKEKQLVQELGSTILNIADGAGDTAVKEVRKELNKRNKDLDETNSINMEKANAFPATSLLDKQEPCCSGTARHSDGTSIQKNNRKHGPADKEVNKEINIRKNDFDETNCTDLESANAFPAPTLLVKQEPCCSGTARHSDGTSNQKNNSKNGPADKEVNKEINIRNNDFDETNCIDMESANTFPVTSLLDKQEPCCSGTAGHSDDTSKKKKTRKQGPAFKIEDALCPESLICTDTKSSNALPATSLLDKQEPSCSGIARLSGGASKKKAHKQGPAFKIENALCPESINCTDLESANAFPATTLLVKQELCCSGTARHSDGTSKKKNTRNQGPLFKVHNKGRPNVNPWSSRVQESKDLKSSRSSSVNIIYKAFRSHSNLSTQRRPIDKLVLKDMLYLLQAIMIELHGYQQLEPDEYLQLEIKRYLKYYVKHKQDDPEYERALDPANPFKQRIHILLNMQNDLLKILGV